MAHRSPTSSSGPNGSVVISLRLCSRWIRRPYSRVNARLKAALSLRFPPTKPKTAAVSPTLPDDYQTGRPR
ncbi:hypothetical protein NOGI109294_04015 [Nocardiopsis gilva]